MSAEINNREHKAQDPQEAARKEERKAVLKEIIRQLHEGKTVDQVRDLFAEHFDGVAASEITDAEQALIESGTTVEEIQSLCDVHSSVFKGSIEEIHMPNDPKLIPGHPVNTLFRENKALEKLIQEIEGSLEAGELSRLRASFEQLQLISVHYQKKENLFFPYMEKYGISAPPKVMWGVDDEIRAMLKSNLEEIREMESLDPILKAGIEESLTKVREMIFKEQEIMVPMLVENLTQDEWLTIAQDTKEFGYCLIKEPTPWVPSKAYQEEAPEADDSQLADGIVSLPTGKFTLEELMTVLNMLPIDITFVDRYDRVKYFSEAKERIFPRARTVIGREVANCHPPASVHIVEGIVNDFKSGKKDNEDFWIKMGPNYILIRYFALRDSQGDYLGTLEVTQNIAPIQALTGEKRLVSMED